MKSYLLLGGRSDGIRIRLPAENPPNNYLMSNEPYVLVTLAHDGEQQHVYAHAAVESPLARLINGYRAHDDSSVEMET